MLKDKQFLQQDDLLFLKDFGVVRWAEVVDVITDNRLIGWDGSDDDHEDTDQQEGL